jgi:hypothetical protein
MRRRLATTPRQTPGIAPAVIVALVMALAASPKAEAGGSIGLHFSSRNFGVTVGVGDWGLYSDRWHDPGWSLDFNAVLGGYGEWVWVDGLGRCWRPWVAASWQPFTHGRWVHTGGDWTWVAFEPWGYVPHHYGNWARSSFGWVWVPGYSYAPANVVWVRAGAYIGWYARPPHGWSHAAHGFRHIYRQGARDGYARGYGDGYRDGWRDARYGTWVDWRRFGTDNVAHHAVNHSVASRHRIEDRAAVPSAVEVERRGGVAVTRARLETRTVQAAGRQILVARPTGVEASVERHAPDTVRTALSERALQQRQPSARRQSAASIPAARPQASPSRSQSSAGIADRGRAPQSTFDRSRRQPSAITQSAGPQVRTGERVAPRVSEPAGRVSPGVNSGRGTAAATDKRRSPPRSGSRVIAGAPAQIEASRVRRPAELRTVERPSTLNSGQRKSSSPRTLEPRSRTSASRDAEGSSGNRGAQRRPTKKHD